MSARDELAELLNRHGEYSTHEGLADIAIADGYRKPRTITTDEDLSAAPKGIVLRELDGLIWEKQGDGEGGAFWVETGDEQEYEYTEISLPATVLWEPQP